MWPERVCECASGCVGPYCEQLVRLFTQEAVPLKHKGKFPLTFGIFGFGIGRLSETSLPVFSPFDAGICLHLLAFDCI